MRICLSHQTHEMLLLHGPVDIQAFLAMPLLPHSLGKHPPGATAQLPLCCHYQGTAQSLHSEKSTRWPSNLL
uniref:Uncharacterized protein n=1 Tax=Arundo donax TaxID=35708 RepID=A0A0A9GJH0_ARUDO